MPPPIEPPFDVDTVRGWVRAERARAGQAAATAARHERLQAAADTDAKAAFHARMALIHHKMAERHRTTARLHERYAARLAGWATTRKRRATVPPRFMAVVAAEFGSASAGLTLMGADRTVGSVIASDDLASAAQCVEFDLGEGPTYDVTRDVRPVVAGVDSSRDRWPRYCPAVGRLGVRSVAAVPLAEARICLGALVLFDSSSPKQPPALLARLVTVADALTYTLLLSTVWAEPAVPLLREQDHYVEIHQAVGMIAVQCDCGVEDALALLRARAFVEDEPVATIARQIVDRTRRFDAAPE